MTTIHGYRIREAAHGDAARLAQWNAAMALETEGKALDGDRVVAGVAAGIGDAARARYFIAMDDVALAGRETVGTPCGMLMLTREWSDWRNGEWWWIQSVYVDPGVRRRGVYAALHHYVEQLARATPGVVGLRLYVERQNEHAQRTYAALGMEDAGYLVFEQEFDPR